MEALGTLLAQLPADASSRGRRFEQLCQWFLRTDPAYAGCLRHVWLWDEWPGRWGSDAGIDLVAETVSGELWAIQAKAYRPQYAVTKHDVDTFLSESARPAFSFRLLIATTDLVGARAAKTMDEQAIPAGFVGLAQLERSPVIWPRDLDDLRERRRPAKRPLPHSQEAITAVRDGFRDHDRGQLVMACGTGKTLIGLWVFEELACERALVLLPSLSLLAQTLREWTSNAASPFKWIAVCSDPSVEEDDLVEHTSELGFPTTTSPATIAAVLGSAGSCVVFATYQSSPRIAEACGLGAPAFDLAIADEAHRCAGPTGSLFATIVDAESIHAKRRLFMTATPRYFTARVKRAAEGADLEVASMDDEERFGPVFHRLTFGQAIERGLLTDYRVVIVGVDDATCAAQVERAALVRADGIGVTDARSLASQIGLAKAIRQYDLRRLVSFHNRISAARTFAEGLPDTVAWMPDEERPTGTLWVEHVSGAMPAGRRETLLRRLRDVTPGARGLLANARCLGEGVDIPAIDGIAFIDPRHSMIDVTQAVGRAIRRSEDKVSGTVVLPVFVNSGADPEEVLTSGAFRAVWDVVRALRAHDDTFAEALDDIRRQLGRTSTAPFDLPQRIRVDLPASVGEEFARAFRVQVVECATATWEQWFGMLEAVVEREHHALVAFDYTENGSRLGQWVAVQRRLQRKNMVSSERKALLESIPGWSWEPQDEQWDNAFALLVDYVGSTGHARIPNNEKVNNFNVGGWVREQRVAYRKGQLSQERICALDALAGWTWSPFDDDWDRGFEMLLEYIDETGHCRFEGGYKENALARWVGKQRAAYRRGRLDPERRSRLEQLEPWTWEPRVENWDEGFRHLEEFTSGTGSARPGNQLVYSGFKLGQWVAVQRIMHSAGQISTEREARLENLPGWTWEARTTAWDDGYAALIAYVGEIGSARVPQKHLTSGGFKLGQWVAVQRTDYNAGRLTPKRIKCLEALPGWAWKPYESDWEENFERLRRSVSELGSSRVRSDYVTPEGFLMGRWIQVQRSTYKQGKLTLARRERLASLPGWEWDLRTKES